MRSCTITMAASSDSLQPSFRPRPTAPLATGRAAGPAVPDTAGPWIGQESYVSVTLMFWKPA